MESCFCYKLCQLYIIYIYPNQVLAKRRAGDKRSESRTVMLVGITNQRRRRFASIYAFASVHSRASLITPVPWPEQKQANVRDTRNTSLLLYVVDLQRLCLNLQMQPNWNNSFVFTESTCLGYIATAPGDIYLGLFFIPYGRSNRMMVTDRLCPRFFSARIVTGFWIKYYWLWVVITLVWRSPRDWSQFDLLYYACW